MCEGNDQLQVVVVGGGVTGLVAACQLASQGYSVTLFEQHDRLGGRWKKVQLGDYQFDLSPIIPLPSVFEMFFKAVPQAIDPHLHFVPLDVNSRNFFASGSMLDLTNDAGYLRDQFDQFSPEDNEGFVQYVKTAHKMYQQLISFVMNQEKLDGGFSLFSPSFFRTWTSIHPFQTMDRFHQRFFQDPRLKAVFNRYASFFGSSPYESPAVLSVVAYLELIQGVQVLEGGGSSFVQSLFRLASRLGVKVRMNCKIDEIMVIDQKVVGVRSRQRYWDADIVVSTVDIRTTQHHMLSISPRLIPEPSYSAFVYLLGVKKKFSHLHYHNFFFPFNYGREFIDIFKQQEWSLSPSIYVRYSGMLEEKDAGKGSNLMVCINVPPMSNDQMEETYDLQLKAYRDNVIYWLEHDWAFKGISRLIEVEKMYGPREWKEMTGAWQGSLYGHAYHGSKGMFRPTLRDSKIKGMYYAGATTFPGGGGLFSILSGVLVGKCVVMDNKKSL